MKTKKRQGQEKNFRVVTKVGIIHLNQDRENELTKKRNPNVFTGKMRSLAKNINENDAALTQITREIHSCANKCHASTLTQTFASESKVCHS